MNRLIILSGLFVASLFGVTACSSSSDNSEVIGSWTGISWEVNGQEDKGRAPGMVTFSFQADQTYTASLGRQSEAGVYHLEQDKLYTTADGMEEKMVVIEKPAPDTLVMLMNRMGVPEKLTLVRNK